MDRDIRLILFRMYLAARARSSLLTLSQLVGAKGAGCCGLFGCKVFFGRVLHTLLRGLLVLVVDVQLLLLLLMLLLKPDRLDGCEPCPAGGGWNPLVKFVEFLSLVDALVMEPTAESSDEGGGDASRDIEDGCGAGIGLWHGQ